MARNADIQRVSDEVLQVEEGSLYPALQRMLIKGWVKAKRGTTPGNRRARYYQLTRAVNNCKRNCRSLSGDRRHNTVIQTA